MKFVSYLAIPMNTIILLICRFPKETIGAFQDMDTLDYSEESILVQWLWKRNKPFWTRANVILLAIAIEHVLISIKIVIALLIPDLPKEVQVAEKRREFVIQKAQKDMLMLKKQSGAVDFAELEGKLEEEQHIGEATEEEEQEVQEDIASGEDEDKKAEKEKKKREKHEKSLQEAAAARLKAMEMRRKQNQEQADKKKDRKKQEKDKKKEKKDKDKEKKDKEDKEREEKEKKEREEREKKEKKEREEREKEDQENRDQTTSQLLESS